MSNIKYILMPSDWDDPYTQSLNDAMECYPKSKDGDPSIDSIYYTHACSIDDLFLETGSFVDLDQ